jgi:hypothetical protein
MKKIISLFCLTMVLAVSAFAGSQSADDSSVGYGHVKTPSKAPKRMIKEEGDTPTDTSPLGQADDTCPTGPATTDRSQTKNGDSSPESDSSTKGTKSGTAQDMKKQ